MKTLGETTLTEQLNHEEEFHEFSQNYEDRKTQLLKSLDTSKKKKKIHSKPLAAAAAFAAVMLISVSVYAAITIFQASVTVDKDSGTTDIHLKKIDDAQVLPIKIYADYLPSGYQEWEENKYSLNGEFGKDGIAVAPANANAQITVEASSEVEETTIQGRKATIITRKGMEYSHLIFLYYEDTGHVIEIMAADAIPLDEVIKVAENIRFEELSEGDSNGYQPFQDTPEIVNEEIPVINMDTIIKKGDTSDYVTADDLGEGSQPSKEGLKYTVEDIQVMDRVPLDHLDPQYFYDQEKVMSFLSEDGTLQPYHRVASVWEDNETKQKDLGTVGMKYLSVTIKMENLSEEDRMDVGFYPRIYQLDQKEDGTLELPSDAFEHYAIQPDQGPFYFDQSSYLEERKHFYFMDFAGKETKEIHLGYAIPEDKLSDSFLSFQESSDFTKYLDLELEKQ